VGLKDWGNRESCERGFDFDIVAWLSGLYLRLLPYYSAGSQALTLSLFREKYHQEGVSTCYLHLLWVPSYSDL